MTDSQTVIETICNRHSVRIFNERMIEDDKLYEILECGRLYSSSANLQPIRFAVVQEPSFVRSVHKSVRWAAYLKDFCPTDQQLPRTYILVLKERVYQSNCEFDAGAAVMCIQLAAGALGIGTCCLKVKNTEILYHSMAIDAQKYEVLYAIAVGYSNQVIKNVEMQDGDVKYYINETGEWCVPKRGYNEVVIQKA